ncbi:hypothetical protein MVEN_00476700 [Mycena venus]|uniref:Uncharacterized protein n=1 Tax=Mycena venus TaxID=2733690 RepID=A0A8H6YTF4_9AGAR|nr:hypothetical protein MVEN_00476700 [Mycena venus]
MFLVTGEPEQYLRSRFYPSPTPSRPANLQLHTPAPSIDSIPAPPSARDASPSIKDLLDQILASKASDSGFFGVARFSRSLPIVTWPTALHESFKWPARPFSNLANALPHQFVGDTNIDIPLPGSNTTTTPDFAFGKIGANSTTVYPIIVESAYSQSPKRLEEKANKHLTRPEVACVVGLDFTTPTFDAPKTCPLAGAKGMSQPEFNVAADAVDKSPLGPIKVGNDVWAPAIERIELAMWCKKPGTLEPIQYNKWDITPLDNDADLTKHHAAIVKLLRKNTLAVIEKNEFNLIFSEGESFKINWQGFYRDLRVVCYLTHFDGITNGSTKMLPNPSI